MSSPAAVEKFDAPLDLRASMVDRPGGALRFLFRRLFSAIQFGDAEAAQIRTSAERGPVVYVLRTVSYLEFLYFNYALSRHSLPLARFANGGVRTILLWPLHVMAGLLLGLWRLARGARLEAEESAMARRIDGGDAVLLFLRPSQRLRAFDRKASQRVRGRFTEMLIEKQRGLSERRQSLQLVPMTLLWGQPPVRPGGRRTINALFGEPEAPGRFRGFLQFVRHHRSALVKVAEPVDLESFIAASPGRSDEALARMLRFELSGRIESERRAVLGPRVKSPARIRQEILRSRRMLKLVDDLSVRKKTTKEALLAQADKQLREIAANPKPWMIATVMRRSIGLVFRKIYDGIDIDEQGLERIRQAAKRGPVLLLPSHRSHIDYLVLSYVFYDNGMPPPHIAAGANLTFFPMGSIFRRSAAFFLRRSFRGDALYAGVFSAYVRKLLREGFNVEFFIEGGRSRSGKLLEPKLGLLGIIADSVIDGEVREVQAVPISITYDKVVEEGSYARELAGGEKRKESLGSLLRAGRILRSQYGRIDLQFGEVFSLNEALAVAGAPVGAEDGARKQAVRRVGMRIAYGIAQTTAITPSALVASACLATTAREVSLPDLEARVRWLADRARTAGARFAAALENDFDGSIQRSMEIMVQGGDLRREGGGPDGRVVVPGDRRVRLEYYKNNAIHALGPSSIVARALLLATKDGTALHGEVHDRALALSRLLKKELIYRPGMSFDAIFAATIAELEVAGWIASSTSPSSYRITEIGREALPVLAGLTASYLEAYALTARVATEHPGAGSKELLNRLTSRGERALADGELTRPEAISRPLFETAISYLRGANAFEEPAVLASTLADLEAARI